MAPAVETAHLTKKYGQHVGLADVSLKVNTGEVLGLLGPNGSGKTTFMRMLMGLLSISSGEVRIFGERIDVSRPHVRASVGYLPGNFGAYDNLTVDHYFQYLTSLRRIDSRLKVSELCDRFSLKRDKLIGSLSKGTKQKIGIVQAFMHSPKLLILDEPTSGLDPLMQREFENLLNEVVRAGSTVLLSSHIMSEVERMARTVAVLDEGRLIHIAAVNAFKQHVHHTIELDMSSAPDIDRLRRVPGVLSADVVGNTAKIVMDGDEGPLIVEAARQCAVRIRTHEPTLDDLFETLLGRAPTNQGHVDT